MGDSATPVSPLAPCPLPSAAHVDVWLVDPEALSRDHYTRLESLQTDEERARQARYAFDHLRRDFAITRGLVREVLTAYAPSMDPRAWRFEVGENGKPSPRFPPDVAPFAMNVSHTRGLIGVAIAGQEVGMDVETLERRAPLEVADRYFAAEEIRKLHALPEEARAHRFFTLWTLKEAWLKAIGTGITHSLSSICLDVDREPPTATFSEDSPPGQWRFARFSPGAHHLGAVSMGADAPLTVRLRWPYAATSPRPS